MHVDAAVPLQGRRVIPFLFHLSGWEPPKFAVHDPEVSVQADYKDISNKYELHYSGDQIETIFQSTSSHSHS